jgi:hypothetical protein
LLEGLPAAAKKNDGSRGIFVYTARKMWIAGEGSMPIFSSLMFRAVRWAARRGLRVEEDFSSDAKKLEARRTGVRGETYA